MLLVQCYQSERSSQVLRYHCRKLAKYREHFLAIIKLLIIATVGPRDVSGTDFGPCIDYISLSAHTHARLQGGEGKAQGRAASLGQDLGASAGLPDSQLLGLAPPWATRL